MADFADTVRGWFDFDRLRGARGRQINREVDAADPGNAPPAAPPGAAPAGGVEFFRGGGYKTPEERRRDQQKLADVIRNSGGRP